MTTLTADRLRHVLSYDEKTGLFVWRAPNTNAVRIGSVAGSKERNYIRIHVDGSGYWAHRLAWLYVYSEWPAGNIDHINRDPSDNRIANLRSVNQSQNSANSNVGKRNTSGYKGVSWSNKYQKWEAKIRFTHIGYFQNKEDAARAYNARAITVFGEYAALNEVAA